MKPLSDPSIISNYPARLHHMLGNARFYEMGANLEPQLFCHSTNCFSKGLFCTYLRLSSYKHHQVVIRRTNQKFLALEYLFSGRMYVHSNDIAYIAEQGDMCLLHPFENHEFLISEDDECSKAGIIFHGSMLDSVMNKLGLDLINVVSFPDQKRVRHFVDRLHREMTSKPTSVVHDAISGIVYEMLQALSSAAAQAALPAELTAICDEIKENLDSRLSVAQLAAKHRMTVQTLNLKFKTHLHTTVYQYLIRQRMLNAKHYLEEGDISVKEVAARVGFENPLSFSTAFRQYYGLSPRKCRVLYKNSI